MESRFIYLMTLSNVLGEPRWQFMAMGGELLTTDFIIDAIAIVMEDYGKTWAEVRKFLVSLTRYRSLRVYTLSLADRIMATEFMKLHNLEFDDGTTYQAMRACSVGQIVSYDNHFDNVPDIKRVTPEEMIE